MKRIVPIVIIILLLGGTAAYVLTRPDESDEQRTNTQSTDSDTTMDSMDMSTQPAQQNEAAGTQPAQETNNVEMRNYAFTPATIRVKKGTTVTWTNRDDIGHDVTPTSGGSDFKASELLSKGESYSFTFDTVGTYGYKCSPHPYMTGTVEVVE